MRHNPQILALCWKNLKSGGLGQKGNYSFATVKMTPFECSWLCNKPNISYNDHVFKDPKCFPNNISSKFLVMVS